MAAEKQGVDGPIRRDINERGKGSGGDLIDGKDKTWDVKDSSAGPEKIANVANDGVPYWRRIKPMEKVKMARGRINGV